MTRDYGEDWPEIKNRVRERDNFQCQSCGRYSFRVMKAKFERDGTYEPLEKSHGAIVKGCKVSAEVINSYSSSKDIFGTYLHVHHKIPFSVFDSPEEANKLSNLVSLCPSCHNEAERCSELYEFLMDRISMTVPEIKESLRENTGKKLEASQIRDILKEGPFKEVSGPYIADEVWTIQVPDGSSLYARSGGGG